MDLLVEFLGTGVVLLFSNLVFVLGLICAAIIISRVSQERRHPGHTLSWILIVVFLPFIGVPLYLIFGGRKSRRMARIKAKVSKYAHTLTQREPVTGRKAGRRRAQGNIFCAKGNRFELLVDGEVTYTRLLNEIKGARHTIHISTYILGNDRCGQTLVDRLVERAQEGVTVRLLLDSLGSWNKTRLARLKIRQAGGEVAMFIPVLPLQSEVSSNLRNHRKIALFDNNKAITGGQNLDNRFLGNWPDAERFHDFSIMTQGPAVAEITRTFIADWTFATKSDPTEHRELLQYIPEEAGASTIEVIASGPDIPNDPLWERVLCLVHEFKRELTIVTPYFIPDELLLQSLLVKANTGRHIQLILPLRSNQWIADIARHRCLDRLNAAGVEILFYEPKMLHAKLIIADDSVALTGSANIDFRSLFVNFEIALAHQSESDIAALNAWVEGTKHSCISYEEASKTADFIPSKISQDLVQFIVPIL